MKNLSRKEKEELFKSKEIELHRLWNNPIPTYDNFDFSGWKDENLETETKKNIGLIRHKKWIRRKGMLKGIFIMLVFVVAIIVIFLGVVGLLLFGIKQLFGI